MHVLALRIELHLPAAQSLKDKRGHLRSIIDGGRRRFDVAVAEVDHQDTWQRSAIGVAAVSSSATLAEKVIDDVERFIWSFPEVEVLDGVRHWMETD